MTVLLASCFCQKALAARRKLLPSQRLRMLVRSDGHILGAHADPEWCSATLGVYPEGLSHRSILTMVDALGMQAPPPAGNLALQLSVDILPRLLQPLCIHPKACR